MHAVTWRMVNLVPILLLTATVAGAQTIAGMVRDTSGAVMPGVTVEASSPALIERVRSATTDGAGQYRIVNLSPGIYDLTFTFSTTASNQFMRPTRVLQGRLFKIGGQIEF